MNCLMKGELLRRLQGSLSDKERAACDRHISICPRCKAAYCRLRETWDLLGEWGVEAPEGSLSDRVLASLAREPSRREEPRRWPAWRLIVSRRAAALLLAAGLGTASGFLVPVGASTGAPTPPGDEDSATVALGLAGLAAEYGTGLVLRLDVGAAPAEAAR